jgi:hypothetical protein
MTIDLTNEQRQHLEAVEWLFDPIANNERMHLVAASIVNAMAKRPETMFPIPDLGSTKEAKRGLLRVTLDLTLQEGLLPWCQITTSPGVVAVGLRAPSGKTAEPKKIYEYQRAREKFLLQPFESASKLPEQKERTGLKEVLESSAADKLKLDLDYAYFELRLLRGLGVPAEMVMVASVLNELARDYRGNADIDNYYGHLMNELFKAAYPINKDTQETTRSELLRALSDPDYIPIIDGPVSLDAAGRMLGIDPDEEQKRMRQEARKLAKERLSPEEYDAVRKGKHVDDGVFEKLEKIALRDGEGNVVGLFYGGVTHCTQPVQGFCAQKQRSETK